MRLKYLYISQYKNLKNFELSFDGNSFIDVFVGKNGSGKSNLFEALIEIFRHLYEYGDDNASINFSYVCQYEINDQETKIEWKNDEGELIINDSMHEGKTIGKTPLPDNVLIYYSGHNDTVVGLVKKYENNFSKRIKKANFGESRRFIGIGPDYKELLLAVLLMQPDGNHAKEFVRDKLGIKTLGTEVRLDLNRPLYAYNSTGKINKKFNIEDHEQDRYWKPEGITKTFLDRLSLSISSATTGPLRPEGYFDADDHYLLYFDIAKIQQEFADFSAQELFRQFDNLKTLGMLESISIPLQLTTGLDAMTADFSDGQYQSVYIYSIVEIFKNSNCITLLDEPDSFLHPEWQFGFLKQVFEITDTTAKNNHVLMSSHSASTISTANENVINLLELDGNKIVVTKVNKANVIKSLSAGLISISESEARLNIHHVLKNTSGAVLFTEGITDEMILETAWSKLYPAEDRKFEIQNAFDRIFLRNLFSRDELKINFPGRVMFALFDFDEAYDDWNGLKKHCDLITDPLKGISKQLKCTDHYAMLLPVPNLEILKRQVLDAEGKPWGRGVDSHISIELLFYKDEWLDQWFQKRPISGGGEIIEFIGDKTLFAKAEIPKLHNDCFEVFRPIFKFIMSKCQAGNDA